MKQHSEDLASTPSGSRTNTEAVARDVALPLNKIGHTTEPAEQYAKELGVAGSLSALVAFGARWRTVASDAEQVIAGMTEADFAEFRKGLAKERRGHFAGDGFMTRYGNIPMPDVLFAAAGTAARFNAPWGLAYIRMRDAGQIVERDGIATLTRRAPPPSVPGDAQDDEQTKLTKPEGA
jgi:hypothetical protein